MKDTVVILNYAPYYRESIFLLMEEKLNCDFYFGHKTYADVKKMDYNLFKSEVVELKYFRLFKSIYWLKNSVLLALKPYRFFILTGEPYCLSSWIILLLNRLNGKRTILWSHGWYGNETGIKKLIKKLYFKLSNELLLYGNYAKQQLLKVGFDDCKLHVVYNSLNFIKHKQILENCQISDIYKNYFNNEFPVILYIGRLEKIKNLSLLLESYFAAIEKKFNFNIVIIGKGRDEENLKEIAKSTDNRVWFYGACYDETILANLLYNADLCVSPGNVGLTAVHCFTFGLPVITHDRFTAQMPEFEIIDKGITGDFFKYENVEDLTNKIINFLSHNNNREFTRKKCVEKIELFYNPEYQIEVFQSVIQ